MESTLRNARTCLLEGKSVLLSAGDKERAIRQLEKGLDLLDDAQTVSGKVSEDLRTIRWQLLFFLGKAYARRPNRDSDKAIQYLQQALNVLNAGKRGKKPDHSAQEREATVSILSRLGDAYSFKKEYRKALKYYKQAAEFDISNQQAAAWIQEMLGNAYTALGKRKEALQAFQSVIRIDPDFQYSDARFVGYHLAQLLYEQKEYDKALGYGLKALAKADPRNEQFPQTYLIHQGLGHIYFAMSSYENAIKHFRKSLRSAPLNAPERAQITRHLNAAKEKLDR